MTHLRIHDLTRRGATAVAVLMLAPLAAGCAVGPDFQRPPAPAINGYTPTALPNATVSTDSIGGARQRFVTDLDIPGQWWALFHCRALNALVEEGLANNHDVKAAQAALRVARESVKAQVASGYPSVTGGLNASREKDATGSVASSEINGAAQYSLYTGQLSISYVPDLFGLNRRTVESLSAQADAQRFQVEATYLTLSSNIVAAAIQEASLRGQIKATRAIIASQEESLSLLRKMNALGEVSDVDVAAQETALAQTKATLAPLEKQLAQQRDMLAALVGRFPSDQPSATFSLQDLVLPTELPVSLPSKVVEHRPDVRAAEENMHAASAQIGVAIANRLPNVTLTANAGRTATQLSEIFMPGNGYWMVASALTQPIFDAGVLLHRQRGAEAAYDQALEQYRSTLLTAFQNVADALVALQHDADALKSSAAAERAAARSLTLVKGQHRLGAVNYLALLTAEQAYQQTSISLVQAQAARFADTAALFQALGGGWWNRTDVALNTQAHDAGHR